MTNSNDPLSPARLLDEHYGLRVSPAAVEPLPSYRDLNFRISAGDSSGTESAESSSESETRSESEWVLKIAHPDEEREALLQQAEAFRRLDAVRGPEFRIPALRATNEGKPLCEIRDDRGRTRLVRLVSWLDGETLARHRGRDDAKFYSSLGSFLAVLDSALADIELPLPSRPHAWDLGALYRSDLRGASLADRGRRELIMRSWRRVRAELGPIADLLPRQWIHHDANDHNLLVESRAGVLTPVGLLDFGDMTHAARIFELAVAGAYAIFGQADPATALEALLLGYDKNARLREVEVRAFLPAIVHRLVLSVLNSAEASAADPDNEYLRVSEAPAWSALAWLDESSPFELNDRLLSVLGHSTDSPETSSRSSSDSDLAVTMKSATADPPQENSTDGATGSLPLKVEALLAKRRRLLAPNLSLSPVEIIRGRGAYLFDAEGRAWLDTVNNVSHVGHAHPRVLEAAERQARELNTNTRYLHRGRLEYAERLLATLPAELEVLYLVNSGSEANELALRLARAATGRRDVAVLEAAYHGHSSALIDMSPYKHARAGGSGAPDWVHVATLPGSDRGYPALDEALAMAQPRGGVAAFFAEPISGCGGQFFFPDGYFAEAFAKVRATGGLCVADEVQVGFGRMGDCWWAFETQDVVPDIVTMGKPIGNGHPMAAVATTRAVAEAFDNGMEFFCTFGGNPVSCAVGLAVLDVIEEEGLRQNASLVGAHLRAGLEKLREFSPNLVDVRGHGLFLGAEFRHADGRPDAATTAALLDYGRRHRIFVSRDGPDENVLKIKPPLCFSLRDADDYLALLQEYLQHLVSDPI